MASINHVHTYIRYNKRPGYYRCAAPNCTHIMDKEFLLGKHSLCTDCGQLMQLTREQLRRVKPKCLDCANTKEARLHRKSQALTKGLGTSAFNIFPSFIKEIEEYKEDQSPGELEFEEDNLFTELRKEEIE